MKIKTIVRKYLSLPSLFTRQDKTGQNLTTVSLKDRRKSSLHFPGKAREKPRTGENINRVLAEMALLSVEERRLFLTEVIPTYQAKAFPFSRIENAVCGHLRVQPRLLRKRTRKKKVVMAKHLVWYFARKNESLSLKEIAKYYEVKCLTTISKGCIKVERNLKNYKYAAHIRVLSDRLKKEL